jgi:hypothetical protein
MTYLELLAREIYSAAHHDELPDAQKHLYINYALIGLALGDKVTAVNVHDAWAAWAILQSPTHPSIRPFNELTDDTQSKDNRYVQAIRQATSRYGQRSC